MIVSGTSGGRGIQMAKKERILNSSLLSRPLRLILIGVFGVNYDREKDKRQWGPLSTISVNLEGLPLMNAATFREKPLFDSNTYLFSNKKHVRLFNFYVWKVDLLHCCSIVL